MSSSLKRSLIILGIIFGTPLLCGLIGSSVANKTGDVSGLTQGLSFAIGIFGVVASLIVGVTVSYLMRNAQSQKYSLMGYFIPSVLAILYVLFI